MRLSLLATSAAITSRSSAAAMGHQPLWCIVQIASVVHMNVVAAAVPSFAGQVAYASQRNRREGSLARFDFQILRSGRILKSPHCFHPHFSGRHIQNDCAWTVE